MSALGGEGVCPVQARGEGVLQMRTSALFDVKKNFITFQIYGASSRTRGRVGI